MSSPDTELFQVTFPGGRTVHNAYFHADGITATTLCGRTGIPALDTAGLPHCAICRHKQPKTTQENP